MSPKFRHAALPVLLLAGACVTPGPGPRSAKPDQTAPHVPLVNVVCWRSMRVVATPD